jgi:hypothetical protein
VLLLFGALLAAMRMQARRVSRPKKELRLRTGLDGDSSVRTEQASNERGRSTTASEPTLKLPRKKPNT